MSFFEDSLIDGGHIRARLFEGDSSPEPREALKEVRASANGRLQPQRFPKLDGLGRELESGRHDAHHGVALVVQSDVSPNGIRTSAEPVDPKIVAHNHRPTAARLFFFGQKAAADGRLDTQSGKEAGA